jgi:acetyltransferase-like isoleucine patch superfamily enzyme
MKKIFLNIFGDLIAKIYISIIKKAIDNYYTKTQLISAQIGKNTYFYGRGTIFFSEKLVIGDNCKIGNNHFFHSKGGITIGNNTILSRNVTIYSANHNYLSEDLIPYDETYIEKKVIIGDSVWVGMNVSILPGVIIEDGAIIGMGTIITKNVKKGEIVVGMGQKVVGSRNLDNFDKLVKKGKFFGKYAK